MTLPSRSGYDETSAQTIRTQPAVAAVKEVVAALLAGSYWRANRAVTESTAREPKPTGSASEIFRRLAARRHSVNRGALPAAVALPLRAAIDEAVGRDVPLRFIVAQGCYKSARVASAPLCDWAEFFHIGYALDRMAELAEVHPPGVELWYLLLDLEVEPMTGVDSSAVEAYWASFVRLVDHFAGQTPRGLRLGLRRFGDLFASKDLEMRLARNLRIVESAWSGESDAWRARELANASRVLSYEGDAPEERVLRAAQLHAAVVATTLEALAPGGTFPGIVVFLRKIDRIAPLPCLPAKSCPTSLTQHWAGTGALLSAGGRFQPAVLSPRRLTELSRIARVVVPEPPVEVAGFGGLDIYE